jgi:hypothetical protein
MAQQAAEVQKWISRNADVVDSAADAQRNLQLIAGTIQKFAAQWTKAVERTMDALGGVENIRAMARMAGEALVRLVESLPPNWPGELDMVRAIELANDGIPVVWCRRAMC